MGTSAAGWFALALAGLSISPDLKHGSPFVVRASDGRELLGPQDIGVTWIEREGVVRALLL
jgi:hypothetical protein